MFNNIFIEFLKSVHTVPGTRYLSNAIKQKNWGTSVLWIFTFIFNTTLCGLMIWYLKTKYNQAQFIVTVENNHPIDDVNFPAISICNEDIILKRQMDTVDRILLANNQTRDRIDRFYNDLSYIQSPPHPSKIRDNYTDVLEILKKSHFTRIDEIMYEGRQRCESMMKFCMINNEEKRCTDIFQMGKTKYGFCCVFNSEFLSYYSEMTDLSEKSNIEVKNPLHILKAPAAGRLNGLFVIFKIETSDIPTWTKPFGSKILVFDSANYPEESMQRRSLLKGQELTLTLYASISHATTAVRQLKPEQRGCWFTDEKKLFLNATYDFDNCITSCRVVKVYRKCGCLPYYYFLPKQLPFKYCSFEDTKCLYEFSMIDVDAEKECDCLPECNDFWISMRNTKRDSRVRQFMKQISEVNATFANYSSDELNSLSILQAYFDTDTCTSYTQDVLVQWFDLIAAYGGTVNLCLGGSIVTVFEILFFFLALAVRKLAMCFQHFK